MKKINFLSAIFSLCLFTATAQHQLSGSIKDGADGAPVPYATAALLRPDSSAVTGVITGDDGKFLLPNVAAGDYILQVSFTGYEKVYRKVNVPAQSDMGVINLAESAVRLQEVVVKAERPLVAMKADRYIVNVSDHISSAGRDAMDILRNTPGILVSNKGSITVLGNSVQVWIDGRPSRMSGEQLQAFLASMQGGEIDRIEVITNPSSRYEAEGSGGIIDIRTKKGLQFGVNGTITAGYRQGRTDSENVGVNLNWRREKFNIYGNYSINRFNFWERISQINVMQTLGGETTLDQVTISTTSRAGLRNTVRAGMDYFVNPKNTLGVIVNAYHADNARGNIKGTTNITPPLNGVDYATADNIKSGGSNGIQVNANYQTIFAQPGQQLNFDLDYARFTSGPFMENANRYFDAGGAMIGDIERLRNANPQNIDVYSAKIDYAQPLWKNARMETGAKISQSKTDNDLKYDVFAGGGWQVDPVHTNRFVYTEQIGAAYLNLNQQLGKFTLQAGLRGEYTSMEGEQKTTGEVNDKSYFDLFPTFFVNWAATQKQTLNLSYSRRLSRPNYNALNPFEIAIDAYSFAKGNPDLTPAYTHNVQLSHTFAQSLMSRVSYSNTKDLIMQAPVVDAASQRTGIIWQNFGRSQNISAMVNYRKQIVKAWQANLTVQGEYQINSSDEASGEFVNKGGAYTVQLNNNFTLTPTLSAELTGMYLSGGHQGYMAFKPQGTVTAGLRQSLLKNKMTLSLNVYDIFFTYKGKASARYENVNYSLRGEYDTRFVNLTLRYNFGSATVKAARNKRSGIEDETSRAGR